MVLIKLLQGRIDPMLLHEKKDPFGTIRVVFTDKKYIDLLFKEDSEAVQSRINITSPDIPVVEYIRAMGLGLSLSPRPKRILFLGHGGGTLAKFYTKYCPDAHIDIVDVRPALYDISKKYFLYQPSVHTRFHTTDAKVFVERAAASGEKYDLILLDIFIDGPSNIIKDPALWENIPQILDPLGFCLSNVWRFNKHEQCYLHILDITTPLFKTTAQTNLVANQCILIHSHLDSNILNTTHVLHRVEYNELRTGVPFTRILRNTKILRR